LLARYGGEEFAIILPETDQLGAIAVMKRLQSVVRQLSIVNPEQCQTVSPTLTISIGGSTLIPSDSDSIQTLIQQADQAMYQAKTGGRNRYIFYLEKGQEDYHSVATEGA